MHLKNKAGLSSTTSNSIPSLIFAVLFARSSLAAIIIRQPASTTSNSSDSSGDHVVNKRSVNQWNGNINYHYAAPPLVPMSEVYSHQLYQPPPPLPYKDFPRELLGEMVPPQEEKHQKHHKCKSSKKKHHGHHGSAEAPGESNKPDLSSLEVYFDAQDMIPSGEPDVSCEEIAPSGQAQPVNSYDPRTGGSRPFYNGIGPEITDGNGTPGVPNDAGSFYGYHDAQKHHKGHTAAIVAESVGGAAAGVTAVAYGGYRRNKYMSKKKAQKAQRGSVEAGQGGEFRKRSLNEYVDEGKPFLATGRRDLFSNEDQVVLERRGSQWSQE